MGRIQTIVEMLLNTAPTAPTVTDVPSTLAVPPTSWPPAPLDPGWSKHWDTAANKWYYHNAATGDSTWSSPPPSGRPPPPPLPLNWIAVWDQTYGRYYYWNAETRNSVWVLPVTPPPLHLCHKQTQHVREAGGTIASDGACTWNIWELSQTTATVWETNEDMPFVPFSGRPSLIQQMSEERLVDPEDILKPTIKKLVLTPWHPETPPIEPPTGEHCVHRTCWKQLQCLPSGHGNLETMD